MTATTLALDILKGERQRYVSVKQVDYLASLHARETGERFRHPDYTILSFNGTGDGWELFRMANGAGILKLISLADVKASGAKRRAEDAKESKAGELNDLFERLAADGVNPRESEEFMRLQTEYRELCRG
jgi:hypothetical protein